MSTVAGTGKESAGQGGAPASRAGGEAGGWLARCDRLDLLAILVLVILAVALVTAVLDYPTGMPTRKELRQRQVADPRLAAALEAAGNLIAAGNPAGADELVARLEQEYPYNGKVHMLRADLYLLRQQPIQAMLSMRRAVDLYPEFLDRKSDDFQGRKVKNTMHEALQAIEDPAAGVAPAERERYRKVYLYLERKLAGSCG